MRSMCWLVFGAALAVAFPAAAAAQVVDPIQIQANPIQIQINGNQVQVVQFNRQGGPLFTPEQIDKLKLSAEQKEKYNAIDKDYQEKTKAAGEKLREAIAGKDRAKIQEALQAQKTETEKLRTDSLAKVEAFLNADQKKTFEEVKKEQPKPNIRPIPLPGAAPGGGKVLPPVIQQRLNLSEEQKKKIDEIQKDLEAKILSVLTEEQRKQLEELKKATTNRTGAIRLIVP